MAFERTHKFLLSLPRVEETLQWDAVVFWVGDKAVGGKMFALMPLEPDAVGKHTQVMSFAVPQAGFHDLLQTDGLCPAPYLARAYWIALESWAAIPEQALHHHLRRAYERVLVALPRKTGRLMEGCDADYRAAVRACRAAAKAKARKES